jgi:nickel-dependent lactate racemase
MNERITVSLEYGQSTAQFSVPARCLLRATQGGQEVPDVADVRAAVRQALESPMGFPPLRQALTPDDRLAIVINENYRRLPDLLIPLLEHLEQAGVQLERTTLVCPPRLPGVPPPPWREELPSSFAAIPVEEHDPKNRARLCYLAGTKAGRRLYLNRTLVEADQIILVGPAGYDPVLGYGGGFGDLFPALGDEETRREFVRRAVEDPPGKKSSPAMQEAEEVGWLLGVPFWLAAIPGRGDQVRHIVAGPLETISPHVRELLEATHHHYFPWRAEVVVTAISGDPRWHRFDDLARALAAAARLVQHGGKIVVLARIDEATLGPAARQLQQFDNLIALLSHARRENLADVQTIWHLAVAARRAHLYIYGSFPEKLAEHMYATAIGSLQEIQRLLDHAQSCIFLPDGHRVNASVLGTMPAVS